MEPDVAAPDPRRELEGSEKEKDSAGNDVQVSEHRIGRKPAVVGFEILDRIRRKRLADLVVDLLVDKAPAGNGQRPVDRRGSANRYKNGNRAPHQEPGDRRSPKRSQDLKTFSSVPSSQRSTSSTPCMRE